MLQLVDQEGRMMGLIEKIAAHEHGGRLHRAVSVLLLGDDGRMLIQQRAASKYHFAGRWANAGCTHPLLLEEPLDAGNRALQDELGVRTTLREVTSFIYVAHDPDSGYTEREYDHVLFGIWNGDLAPNPTEVAQTRWVTAVELREWIARREQDFAFWFLQILRELARKPGEIPDVLASFVSDLERENG